MGTLYLVGTPIGNLEDISLRALRVLREVPLIAAEDTRTTRKLLDHYQITTPLISYHEYSRVKRLDKLLRHLEGEDLALVSDAGMPGLSDPGYELVRAALDRGNRIVPIVGPSAIVGALVVSGLPTNRFLYLGFLPRRSAALRRLLEGLAGDKSTLVAYESPHRLMATLEQIQLALGQRPMAVARELTKLHEEVLRGTPAELIRHFTEQPPRGEITLVISGATDQERPPWDDARVTAEMARRLEAGETPAAAAKTVAKLSGRPRRDVYLLAIKGPAQG